MWTDFSYLVRKVPGILRYTSRDIALLHPLELSEDGIATYLHTPTRSFSKHCRQTKSSAVSRALSASLYGCRTPLISKNACPVVKRCRCVIFNRDQEDIATLSAFGKFVMNCSTSSALLYSDTPDQVQCSLSSRNIHPPRSI